MCWFRLVQITRQTRRLHFDCSKGLADLSWMAPGQLALFLESSKFKVWKRLQNADVFSAGLTFFYLFSDGFYPFCKRDQFMNNITKWDAVNANSKFLLIIRRFSILDLNLFFNSDLLESHYARRAILEVMLNKNPMFRVDWKYALEKSLLPPSN